MSQNNDVFYLLTGISSAQISTTLGAVLDKRSKLQTGLVEQLTRHPPESLTGFLLGAATTFYLAEHKANPQIKTFVDALYYISTCLTVGYADVFPVTQTGRLIASLVMTLGPALANNALDPPGREKPASIHNQAVMVEQLEAILEALHQGATSK